MKPALARGIVGGVVGGVLMALWSMMAMWQTGVGFWTPLNLVAHTAFASVPLDATFSPPALVIASLVHFAMAIMFGVVFAALMTPAPRRMSTRPGSVLSGIAYGIVVWLVMQFLVWSAADAVAASAFVPWIFGVGHLIYGLTVGFVVGRVQRTVGPALSGP